MVFFCLGLISCATTQSDQPWSKQKKGTAWGAGIGVAVGAGVGALTKGKKGALWGALGGLVLGGLTGNQIGSYGPTASSI